jgi:hypothetical protein
MVKYVGAYTKKAILRSVRVPKVYPSNPQGPNLFGYLNSKLILFCRPTPPVAPHGCLIVDAQIIWPGRRNCLHPYSFMTYLKKLLSLETIAKGMWLEWVKSLSQMTPQFQIFIWLNLWGTICCSSHNFVKWATIVSLLTWVWPSLEGRIHLLLLRVA